MSRERKRDILKRLAKAGSEPGAESEVRKKFWSYFKKNKSDLPFFQKLEAMYGWMVSGRMTGRDKAVLVGALLYFINPLDLLPDFSPFIGFFDDVGVVGLAFRYLSNRAMERESSDQADRNHTDQE